MSSAVCRGAFHVEAEGRSMSSAVGWGVFNVEVGRRAFDVER